MTLHSRVAASQVDVNRLDAEYYGARFVANSTKISAFGALTTLEGIRLGGVPIRRGIDMPIFVDEAEAPLMVPIAAFSDPGIEFSGLKRVSRKQHNAFSGSAIKPGDLLVAMGGYPGRAAICPPDTPLCNIGRHTARIVVDTLKGNPYYVWAFISSDLGTIQFERYITGSVQAGVNLEDLRNIQIPHPERPAQRYIGDKVRQAEWLNAWAKTLVRKINGHFASLVQNPIASESFWRVAPEDISAHRINPKEYDPVVLHLIHRAVSSGVKLVSISEILGPRGFSGGATPKGAHYVDKGTFFARVQNVKPLALDLSDAVFIDKRADEQLARSRCAAGDIILTITGYPGTASLVTDSDLPVNINQHSIRMDCSSEYDAAYICAALNSEFVKYQVERSAIGATRDALDYPSVGRLLIPRLDALVMNDISDSVRDVISARRMSMQLVSSAKFLVESLIEGQITESQLIATQQALEAGDDSLDRTILARLKTDGIDGAGEPLFLDLDQLYDLLERAKPETEA